MSGVSFEATGGDELQELRSFTGSLAIECTVWSLQKTHGNGYLTLTGESSALPFGRRPHNER